MKHIRCQAVILKDNQILVLKQYNFINNEEYWLLPGGKVEEGETPEEAIKREIKEETNLDVDVKALLFDEFTDTDSFYSRHMTFSCVPKGTSFEKIGNETVSFRKILELVWCSIINENDWNPYLLKSQFNPSMNSIKNKLLSLKILV